ncbi:MAG: YcxB family protein [Lachnospiraceae bacterium]|nr:YcxB family protein [Lachnospiraceae bacterium]
MNDERAINIKVKISVGNLYEFMMNNNYVSVRGVVSVLFSLVSAVGTVIFWNEFAGIQKALMLFMALLFTVIAPIEYYVRAMKQVKKNFKDEMEYIFDDSGITIRKDEESSSLKWNEVLKVINTKNLVVVYFTPIRAFIIPKSCIGDNFDELKALMEKSTNCYKFKMEK